MPSIRSPDAVRHLDAVSGVGVGHLRRINHRMHNKLFVVDNAIAVTGGRNVGDQYFMIQRSNFIDLDVVAAGAIVPQLSKSFDAFWNSKYAYPLKSPRPPTARRREAAQGRAR